MAILDGNPEPNQTRPPLIVLTGATASGKSEASLRLAEMLPLEIVNADSRSFYRGMDIGTAKPSRKELARVPHHLIDILDPADPMSLATFQDLAMTAIQDIQSRGKVPIMVGGTPQYTNAIVEGWVIPRVEPNQAFRQAMNDLVEREGIDALISNLRAVDQVSAERSGANARRIIRALEVYEATGQPISELQGKRDPGFRLLEVQLVTPREVLHRRIADRARRQIKDGLIEEVRRLLDSGVPRTAPALSSIGYRQVFPYLDGEATLDETVEAIIHDSNKLVRHQETWFRRNERAIRLDTTRADWEGDLEMLARGFLDVD